MLSMDIAAYLRRIGYDASLEPTHQTLEALHEAHLLSVPFENLDIHLGRPILLDEASLFTKVVGQRRGGFCYELNGLFATALRTLGFTVTLLSAEVASKNGAFSPAFDHLALLVQLEQPWLVDVGFGDSFRRPLRMDNGGEQAQGDQVYRLSDNQGQWVLWHQDKDAWKAQYRFAFLPRVLAEFGDRCRFHQTSPDSHFVQSRICTQATPDGRMTLSDTRLIITKNGVRQERELAGEEDFRTTLHTYFHIEFTDL